MNWKNPKKSIYLTTQHLSNLKDHKYSCTGKSVIEPFFQLFWNWVIKYVPISIAPNTLTLIGLIVNVFSVLIITYYSPDGKKPVIYFHFAPIWKNPNADLPEAAIVGSIVMRIWIILLSNAGRSRRQASPPNEYLITTRRIIRPRLWCHFVKQFFCFPNAAQSLNCGLDFVVLGSILSVGMGTYPWLMFLQYFITVTLFYLAHWQVYVTGTLQFGK